MKWLIVSDLHFSMRPVDEFFWSLFPQVENILVTNPVDAILIEGDLCQSKDNHSAALVNRLTDSLIGWLQWTKEIYILRGNHDGLDPNTPYFRFLDHFPCMDYISAPTIINPIGNRRVVFLPHSTDPTNDWAHIDITDSIVFAHATVDGVTVNDGFKLSSPISPLFFDKALRAYSGDIHHSQKIGNLEYIGSPYATVFGDNNFQGRALIFDFDTLTHEEIHFDFPSRLTFDISSLDEFVEACEQIKPKDQVKVRFHFTQETMHQWREMKTVIQEEINNIGAQLFFLPVKPQITGLVPQSERRGQLINFESFCKSRSITPELQNLGQRIIKQASQNSIDLPQVVIEDAQPQQSVGSIQTFVDSMINTSQPKATKTKRARGK